MIALAVLMNTNSYGYSNMLIAQNKEHKAGFIDKDIAVNTPDFFELNLKAGYDFNLYKGITMQVNAGVHNIFNAYQSDFDRGAKRDSGYIYGPGMPRSVYAVLKLSY